MKRHLLAVVAILGIAGMHAQQNTRSPYSFYALGELKFKGTIENRMMAGLNVFTDSIHINLQNPAAYSQLKLTTYSAALSYTNLTLKNESETENTSTVTFNYLSLGIPLGKRMGAGLGLMPYTAVGYQLENIDDTQPQTITDRYTGEGGLNRVYFSLGYGLTDEISIGVTGNYNFGSTQNETFRAIEDVELFTRETNRSDMNGLSYNLALNYKKLLGKNKNYTLHTSFLYSPENKIQSENSRTITTLSFDNTGEEVIEDREDIDLEAMNLRDTQLNSPSSATFSIGLEKNKKWFVGAAYHLQNMSTFSNPFVDIANFEYENAYSVSVGGFFIPRYDSFTNYWNRVVYRAGVRYEKTGLRVNNNSITDFGISFGVGLPLGSYVPNTNTLTFAGLFSNINVGVDFGRRGMDNLGIIQENYFNLNISLSLNDKWFVKRKYN